MRNPIMHSSRFLSLRIAALLAAVATAATLRAVDTEPFTLPVGFSFRINNMGNGIMTVYGEGASPSVSHTTINANTESDARSVKLSPGKSYRLNLQASGPYEYWLSLTPPSGYQVYINGAPKDLTYRYTGGGEYSYNYDIEIRPASGEAVLETGTFTGIDLGQAVSWELGMGRSRGGHSVGRVGFRELDLSNSPASRYRLFYTPPLNSTQVNVVWDGASNQRIRQIASPHKVMDFVDDGASAYVVNYYDFDDTTWTGSIYTIKSGATPWRRVRVESPASNQLQITENENQTGAVERVSQLTLTSGTVSTGTYTWTLLEGGPSGAWLRKTIHASTASGGVRENIVRVYTMNGSSEVALVAETKYVYHTYPWGEDLYQVIANFNGGANALTTAYDYYETAPVTGSETNRGHYGRVKSITDPQGGWVAYEYYDEWNGRGQLKYRYRPEQDSPASATLSAGSGRVDYYTYVADSTGRFRWPASVQESVNGVATAKTEWTYDTSSNSGLPRIKADAKTYYGSGTSAYLSTRTEVIDPISADVNESGEPYVTKRPDHTQTSWSRSAGDYSYGPNYTFTVNASTGQHWRILKVNGTTEAGGAQSQSTYDGQSFEPVYLVPGKSTMEVTILRFTGSPLRREMLVYVGSGSWSPAFDTVNTSYNSHGRITAQVAGNGAGTSYAYDANGRVQSITGGDGVVTTYGYDALGRTATVTKVGASASGIHAAQADVTTTYAYDGANRVTAETVSAGGTSETLVTSRTYDLSGRLTSATPPGLGTTVLTYSAAGRTQTATAPAPDSGTTVQETYRDGRLKSVTGTATVPTFYTYAVETAGRQRTQVNSGAVNSPRLQLSWTDWLGRAIMTQRPGFAQSEQAPYVEEQIFDGTTGQLVKTTRTGYAPTRLVYDTLGRVIRSGLDFDDNGLVAASNDRITETDTVAEPEGTTWWQKTITTTYPDAGAATHPIVSTIRQRLSGLSTSLLSEVRATDAEGNTTITVTGISGKLVTAQTTVPGLSASDAYAYTYNGLASAATGHDGLTTKLVYDALGRRRQEIDARGNATTTAYRTGTALIYTVTDDANPTNNTLATYYYDVMGRVTARSDAAGHNTRYAYNPRGQVTHRWGDGAYPAAYTYDTAYGDRIGLSTFRAAPAGDATTWPTVGDPDLTIFHYDGASGLLWKKEDAAGEWVELDYNVRGLMSRRTLARGVYTDFEYNAAGEPTSRNHSDSTPDVAFSYTRLGQVEGVSDGTGTWDYVYDPAKPWRLAATVLPAFYGTRVQTLLYETTGLVGRYRGFQVGAAAGGYEDMEQAYTYATDGRFDTLASKRSGNAVSRTFDYAWYANTPFVAGYTIPGGPAFTVTRDYEAKQDLLKTVDTQWGGVPVVRHDYTYDARYQRQTGKLSGSAFSDLYAGSGYSAVYHHYAYNARGELQTAAMYRGDTPSTTPSAADELPGRRYEYRYDGLGNRQSAGPTGAGADDVYETNALNQYDWKENNLVRVTGSVAASASGVLVKGTGAGVTARKDRAWTAELLPANENQAVLGSATIYAALAGGGAGGLDLLRTETKSYFVPKSVQAFEYDADGNLTHDSVWDYVYDAENRLIQIQHRSEVIGTGKIASADARKLVFAYDYLGRRVRKTVYGGWNGSAYTGGALSDTKYLYDGWNLMVEFDALSGLTVKRAYTWGLDLTGSLTAAGGVGALLQVYDAAAGKTVLPAIDGSGNVMAMVNADTGALEAVYEYDPYGNLLRKEGKEGEPNYAVVNPIRFASKYTDEETGLVCYGTRYYAPSLGRFINRDTIGEEGGLNLYAYVSNRVPNAWDLLGMAEGEGAWISGVLGEDGIWRYTTEYAPTGMDMVEAGIRASGSIGWMSYAEGATASQLAAVVAYQTAQVNYAIGKVNDAAAAVIGNVTANAVNQATAAAAGYLANNAAQAIASIGSTAYAGLAAGQASYSASTAGAVAANFSAGQAPILAALDSRMMSMEEGMRYAPASTSSPLDNLSPAEYAATQGAIMAREQQRASQVKPFQAIAGSFAEKRAVLNGGANLVLAGTLAGVAAPTAILYAAPAVTTMIAGGKLAVPIVATDMTAMAQSAYVHAMVAAGTNTGQIILYSSLEVLGAKYGGAAMPYPEGTAAAALTTIYLGIIN